VLKKLLSLLIPWRPPHSQRPSLPGNLIVCFLRVSGSEAPAYIMTIRTCRYIWRTPKLYRLSQPRLSPSTPDAHRLFASLSALKRFPCSLTFSTLKYHEVLLVSIALFRCGSSRNTPTAHRLFALPSTMKHSRYLLTLYTHIYHEALPLSIEHEQMYQ